MAPGTGRACCVLAGIEKGPPLGKSLPGGGPLFCLGMAFEQEGTERKGKTDRSLNRRERRERRRRKGRMGIGFGKNGSGYPVMTCGE